MAIKYDKYYRKIVLDRWEAGKFTSQNGTEAIKRYATEEEVEEEAERDEAALKTRISADDGGVASNILRLPSADGMRPFNKTNSKKTSNLQTAVRKKSDEIILNSSTKISE